MQLHSFYPPGCKGAGDFRKFSVRGCWEIFGLQGGWPFRGAPKSRGEGEDFKVFKSNDEFGKNVLEKFSKFSKHSIQFFIFMYH